MIEDVQQFQSNTILGGIAMKKIILTGIALLLLFAGAALAADVVLTSVGQSPDSMMVRVVLRKVKIDAENVPLLKAEDLKDQKVLVAVVGGSSKGLGAAGINKDQEVERVVSLLKSASEKGIKILVMHIGGEGRRGTLSDAFIEAAAPWGERFIIVDGGNADGIFDRLKKTPDVKILTAPTVTETSEPLKSTLSEWGVAAQ